MRDDDLPAIRRAGLLPAVLAVEALLAAQDTGDPQRWRRLTLAQLLDHVDGHARSVVEWPSTIDSATSRPEAEHLAARALMLVASLEGQPRG